MHNKTHLSRRSFVKTMGLGLASIATVQYMNCSQNLKENNLPNFIIIFCDDLGYGDIGCFGSTLHRTPNLDRMAAEGKKFTSFYVSSGVCTPSRSSLMTGCYPRRVNMHMNATPVGKNKMRQVLFPVAKKGLNPNEITIAELLKQKDYATACIGKWHLGDQLEFLPTRQGFDYYYGIPYSNDMGANQFPVNPPLPLLRNEKVIEAPVDQNTITRRYTEQAVTFIQTNKDRPFFLYLPHAMPHNPVHASELFRGKSANNGYGDAVEEIDWSMGESLKTLRELNIDNNTLVIFTSDNGAAQRWGGSNIPLKGWKGSTLEGGMRVPCVMRWPGKIPAGGTCNELTTTMDLLPTLTRLAGTSEPRDRIIDGKNIWPLMAGVKGATSPHEVFYYYKKAQLQAVRSGQWKLYLPLDNWQLYIYKEGTQKSNAELYDLENDISEKNNVADEHQDIVKKLLQYAEQARKDLGDVDREGLNQRPAGLVVTPRPLVMV